MSEPLVFEHVQVFPLERRLLVGGVAQVLGTRAFDLLLYLIEHRDRVLPKSELMDKVWSGVVVEDNNLTVQMSALRKVLGNGAITNLARQGYRFTLMGPTPGVSVASSANEPLETPGLPLPDKPSLVILPFLHFSTDMAQAHLTDGITEDITTELSRFRSLFVISRNSAFTYKGRHVNVRDVAHELGVQYVVEGSVRLAGPQMRVTAQLVEAASGGHVWADKFDGPLEDLFTIQDEVVRCISVAVAQGVQSHEYRSLRQHPTSISAYGLALQAYRLASDAFNLSDEALCQQAIQRADAAMAQDPNCAMAWNAKALASWQSLFFGRAVDRAATQAQAMAAADRLIELDSSDATGYTYRGLLLQVAGESAQALICLRHAYQLNPNDVPMLGSLGMLEIFNGNPAQAIEPLQRARRINPLDPWAWSPQTLLGLASFALFDYRTAREQAQVSVNLAPHVVTPHALVAVASVGLGDMEGAAAAISKALQTGREFIRHRLGLDGARFATPEITARYRKFVAKALLQLDPTTVGDLMPLAIEVSGQET